MSESKEPRKNCETCRFLAETADSIEIGARRFTCRRFPPTAAIAGVDQGGNVATIAIAPPVSPSFWCGEWRAWPLNE